MTELARMTPSERSAVMAPLLKATALAARIQRRLTIAAEVGWPVDVAADLAEGRRLLAHANAELVAAAAKRRFEARYYGR